MICNLVKETYNENDYIFKENDEANCLYIVKEGEIECRIKGKAIRTLKSGEFFGEKSILLGGKRTLDVVAKSKKVVLCAITTDILCQMMGMSYREELCFAVIKAAFQSSKYLNGIDLKLISYENFRFDNFEKNSLVLDKGTLKSSKIYIIIEGSLVNVN